MSQFIGKLGQLVELSCEGSEKVSQTDRYTEHITVEGRRRVQAIAHQPRQWDISWNALSGEDEEVLAAFAMGAWGRGPWHWVPVQAQYGNLLTPRQSELLEYRIPGGYFSDGGPVRNSDGGWTSRSVSINLPSGWVGLFDSAEDDLPVMPGQDFTWSADLDSGGSAAPTLQLQFLDDQGGSVGFYAQSGTSGPGMQRVSMTKTVPEGATSALVGVRAPTSRLTRPQASWSSREIPYTVGRGCRSVVVDGWSSDLQGLRGCTSGLLSKSGFTILEVS